MRKVIYAGTAFYTGDRISAAILEFASALARQGASETVFVPARTESGELGEVEVLLGPASQLVTEPADRDWDDVIDDEFAISARGIDGEIRTDATRICAESPAPLRSWTTSEPRFLAAVSIRRLARSTLG